MSRGSTIVIFTPCLPCIHKGTGSATKGTAGARAAHISLVPSCPAAPLPSYRPTRPARAVPPESSSAYAATATRGASTMASLALL